QLRSLNVCHTILIRLANVDQTELLTSLSPGVDLRDSNRIELHFLTSLLWWLSMSLPLDQSRQSLDLRSSVGERPLAGEVELPKLAFGNRLEPCFSHFACEPCHKQPGDLCLLNIERNNSVGLLNGCRVCSFGVFHVGHTRQLFTG